MRRKLLLESFDLALKSCLVLSLQFVDCDLMRGAKLFNRGLRLCAQLLEILAVNFASLVLQGWI